MAMRKAICDKHSSCDDKKYVQVLLLYDYYSTIILLHYYTIILIPTAWTRSKCELKLSE